MRRESTAPGRQRAPGQAGGGGEALGRDTGAGLCSESTTTGCSAAWLARLTGGQKVGGSNPPTPIQRLSEVKRGRKRVQTRHAPSCELPRVSLLSLRLTERQGTNRSLGT